MKANAFANDSIVLLSWTPATKIRNCLGFAISRIDVETGKKEVLKSYVPFEGETNKGWKSQPSNKWPVQKCNWMDYTGKPGKSYEYEITPMCGKPGALRRRNKLAVRTNRVTLSTKFGDHIQAAFTRGILSTQALAAQLGVGADGLPDFQRLLKAIQTPGDPIRKRLAGNVPDLLMAPLRRARAEGGHVYQALYELTDPEFIALLKDNLDLFSLVLANAGKDDITNRVIRAALHGAGADITDRILEGMCLGHNKSQVYVDALKRALSVTSGSANYTFTGLTCQTNNVLSIDSPELAQVFLDYWHLLRADGNAMSAEFRAANGKRKRDIVLSDGTQITVWFSPNTQEREKPKTGAPVPPDMAEVFQYMRNAKQSIHFLAFFPGFPSIISEVQNLNRTRADLLIRGAVSSENAMPRTKLFHRRGEMPVLVHASAIEKEFAHWQRELLKLPEAHAIIHDKVVVIDALLDECVIIVGSHNLGFKASYQNDENMLIIRGNRRLAIAYLVHILSVYNHFRFRSAVNAGRTGFKGFLSSSPDWQDKYLIGGAARRELEYFTSIELPKAA